MSTDPTGGTPPSSTPVIRFEDVEKSFGDHTVLSDLHFDVAQGERVTLIGPSGSGKTTILRLVMTLEELTGGYIWIDGQPLTHAARAKVVVKQAKRGLRVVLVLLGAVRQSHGHELGGDLVLAQLLHGQLCEPPRERGVHAAADAQHEAPGVRRPEVVAQEVDAPRRLRLRVDPRGHPELGDDLCLQFTHAAMLATACFRGVTDPRPTTPLGRLGESLTVTPHLARMAGANHVRHLSCQQRVSVPGRMRWWTVTRACEAGNSGVVRCWPHD